ncbi:MAG: glutamate--tRNA ligase [Candidatus Sumerlaeia bacterium]|nr:glutamate--tRNA ligase [Candidatus Sumerlaeia bacterium]
MTIRVRFAPSPTGYLHVGGARTALFNYLWAKKNGGTFILRIEDTDEERSTEDSVAQIYESMRWLGLHWDEGPVRQSDRAALYQEALRKMEAGGHLYRAFDTKEELEEIREQARLEKRNPIYDRRALRLTPAEVQAKLDAGVPFVWRFRVPDEGATRVPDTLQGEGECVFQNSEIGDFIITRPGTIANPGGPLYNFCCAVDDAEMRITHVIRGADHLSNTARQILMLEALGAAIPQYTHLPLILKGGKKMSKRDVDADGRFPVSVSARRDLGYHPEATFNFLALLGWSFDGEREILTRDEIINAFSLDRLSKSNANFDEDKYLFLNGWYTRHLPTATIVARVRPFLEAAGFDLASRTDEWIGGVVGLEIERCKLLTEFPEALRYFFAAPASYEEKGAKKFFTPEGLALLEDSAARLETATDWSHDGLEAPIKALAEEKQLGLGKIAQPLRLAVSGRTATPGLFEVLHVLGREETLSRIRRAVEVMRAAAP